MEKDMYIKFSKFYQKVCDDYKCNMILHHKNINIDQSLFLYIKQTIKSHCELDNDEIINKLYLYHSTDDKLIIISQFGDKYYWTEYNSSIITFVF